MRKFFWVFLVLLIVFRYFTTRPVYKNGDIVRVTSGVVSDPVTYGVYQYISVAGLKVYLPIFPEINYGDKIIIEGIVNGDKLEKPKLISQESLKNFGSGFRKRIIDFYLNSLPQPMSGLTAGVVLGSKGALSESFWEKTKNTGVAHVVVASGTNITFVIAFIFSLLNYFLPRRKSIPFIILSIILYLFLSGFQAPIIRASIMATFAFWAQKEGRIANAWRIYFLTAAVMLIINPDWLFDIGFILSFVSTGSIMLFNKRISMLFKKLPEVLKEGLTTSLAAQIGVAPILFVTFGQFNLLSPVINMLVLWTIPYIMILGAAGGVVGTLIPIVGKTILYISYPLTWWFTEVVSFFSR